MSHKQLINYIKEFGEISEYERECIERQFIPIRVKKKQVILERNSPCNKLFFVNKGLLRIYYIDNNGNEFTRRIAWENSFLTNMDSFINGGINNNETIECIEKADVLEISKKDLDSLFLISDNLSKIYQKILEKYIALNIRHYQHLSTSSPLERLDNFNKNYPHLKNRISDTILSTFLSISRKTILRMRKELLKKNI